MPSSNKATRFPIDFLSGISHPSPRDSSTYRIRRPVWTAKNSRGGISYLITNNCFALWLLAAAAKTLDSSWEAQTPVDSSRFHRVLSLSFLSFLVFFFWFSLFRMTLVILYLSINRSSVSFLFFVFVPFFHISAFA